MRKLMIAAALAAATTTAPAIAQVNTAGGLVNVQIGDVTLLNNFLNDTQIAALNNLNVPINVQVPVGIAAAVCDVNANVLAQQRKTGGSTCEAKNGSAALARAVNDQVLNQRK